MRGRARAAVLGPPCVAAGGIMKRMGAAGLAFSGAPARPGRRSHVRGRGPPGVLGRGRAAARSFCAGGGRGQQGLLSGAGAAARKHVKRAGAAGPPALVAPAGAWRPEPRALLPETPPGFQCQRHLGYRIPFLKILWPSPLGYGVRGARHRGARTSRCQTLLAPGPAPGQAPGPSFHGRRHAPSETRGDFSCAADAGAQES